MDVLVWLWFAKERFHAKLEVFLCNLFTMGDRFTLFHKVSQLSLVTLGDHRLRNYLFAVQNYLRKQLFSFFDHFDDGLARPAGQVLTRMSVFYVADCVELWSSVGTTIGAPLPLLVWNLGWSKLVVGDEKKAASPEIGSARWKLVDCLIVSGQLSVLTGDFAVVEFTSRAFAIATTVVFLVQMWVCLWQGLLPSRSVAESFRWQEEQLQSLKRCYFVKFLWESQEGRFWFYNTL